MEKVKTKRYYINRIYLVAVLFYYFLTLPLLGFIWFKQAPDIVERRNQFPVIAGRDANTEAVTPQPDLTRDTILTLNRNFNLTAPVDEEGNLIDNSENREPSTTGKTFSLAFRLMLIGWLLFLVLNVPFRNYMKRKRKGKDISEKQEKLVKKYLTRIPVFSAGLLLFMFTILHLYMIITMQSDNSADEISRELYKQYFYISLAASVLSSFFVFLWQKHRVHLLYLECVFSDEELRMSVFRNDTSKINRRLNVVSLVTVIIPLSIMIMYLWLGTSNISDLGELTDEKIEVLMGSYSKMPGMMEVIGNKESLKDMYYVNALDQITMYIGIITGMIVAVLFLFFILRWNSYYIVTPINDLVEKMRLTGRGELNSFCKVKTNDEIGELTQGYNEMTGKLSTYITELKALSNANSRFVPSALIHALGKDDITDVELGDQIQKEMTVLFSDIRSFTTLSENMTPKETFDFINEYLGVMEPVIRNNNGFIDKYIGDAIMALFEEPADACKAAEKMQSSLELFNRGRIRNNLPEVRIGTGINTGNTMMGIVGGEGRISGTVISDSVNTASRLEGLTKTYTVPVIISDKTFSQLSPRLKQQCRYLDIVVVRGKKETVKIYEFFAHDNPDRMRFVEESQTIFDSALTLYLGKQFTEAEEVFSYLSKAYPSDPVLKIYLERCRKYNDIKIPENWEGIALMNEK